MRFILRSLHDRMVVSITRFLLWRQKMKTFHLQDWQGKGLKKQSHRTKKTLTINFVSVFFIYCPLPTFGAGEDGAGEVDGALALLL